MITLSTLSNCDSCRAATKWLWARKISFEERAIRETPPTLAQLRTMLTAMDGDVRRLFNTSGRVYREKKLSETLPMMAASAALALLASDGNLVKRPFLIGDGVALVGFDEAAWSAAFSRE